MGPNGELRHAVLQEHSVRGRLSTAQPHSNLKQSRARLLGIHKSPHTRLYVRSVLDSDGSEAPRGQRLQKHTQNAELDRILDAARLEVQL